MTDIHYQIEFFSYWHCGSGMAAGAGVDALVVKDGDGLPFVPGKTVKGLVRQAYEELFGRNDLLFGNESGNVRAQTFFSDTVLEEARKDILSRNWQRSLFRSISSTAIDENGIADPHSLRKTQVTVPCTLTGRVLHVPDGEVEKVEKAMRLVKQLGYHRSRGLGRCQFSVTGTVPSPADESAQVDGTLRFQVTLLTNVILNSEVTGTDPNKTLDFIPGNVFLGIAATDYASFGDRALTVFHSGKVRFSDAHPLSGGARTLRVPASLYYPKLSSPSRETCHHHLLSGALPESWKDTQPKQCRSGFYDLLENPAPRASTPTAFAVKSAYDRDKRRSKDEQLFQYESLEKGQVFAFSIDTDPDVGPDVKALLRKALVGERHVGRSRSAQYGLVRIEEMAEPFREPVSRPVSSTPGRHLVYADGRLIFFDADGMPTFRPTAADFGFTAGEVRWDLSQVRTFRYAPWNGVRRSFDADRCGIEKGSVLVIESPDEATPSACYVGLYRNEGFGKVLFNPSFLEEESLLLSDADEPVSPGGREAADAETSGLLRFLEKKEQETKYNALIYRFVNDWVDSHSLQFREVAFASQWGAIRSLASRKRDYDQLMDALFAENADQQKCGFLLRGVAREKWAPERGEQKYLYLKEDFMERLPQEGLPRDWVWKALVNLCSVMGKNR